MKVGVIGAGTMGQGIAKAFAMVDGYEVALCDIKQEWADGGKDKIAASSADFEVINLEDTPKLLAASGPVNGNTTLGSSTYNNL